MTPADEGLSYINSPIIGTITKQLNETAIETLCQPILIASVDKPGKKINCPVAVAAVRPPITRPRFLTNHLLAMLAANTNAMEPVPIPTTTPHRATNCQGF